MKAVSTLFEILCFLPPSQIQSWFFFIKGTKKGTNMFNVIVNLRKFHCMKPDKSYSKDLYFFVAKLYLMVTELRQDRVWACVDFRIFRHLAIFPPMFSFRLTFFFRGWRPVNITGAVTGNPRFHQIQTVLCLTVFKTPFQMTVAPP